MEGSEIAKKTVKALQKDIDIVTRVEVTLAKAMKLLDGIKTAGGQRVLAGISRNIERALETLEFPKAQLMGSRDYIEQFARDGDAAALEAEAKAVMGEGK